jgi:long-chain-fatty-acid--CoA ligase ACSBG
VPRGCFCTSGAVLAARCGARMRPCLSGSRGVRAWRAAPAQAAKDALARGALCAPLSLWSRAPAVAGEAPRQRPGDYLEYDRSLGPFWTMESSGSKRVLYARSGIASFSETPTRTLIELMELAVLRKGDKAALRVEDLGADGGMPKLVKGEKVPPALPLAQWRTWTWSQYLDDTRKAAKGLLALGHAQHDAVSILGFNAPQWLIGQMGAIFAGGKVAGIYPSDTPPQVEFKCQLSSTSVVLVDTEQSLAKVSEVIDRLPYLKAVVCWRLRGNSVPQAELRRVDGSAVKLMTFDELLRLGAVQSGVALSERQAGVRPEHCAGLIYTSGTTGSPKACMLSHDNYLYETRALVPLSKLGTKAEEERILSYLPLSHVAGSMLDIVTPITATALTEAWMCTAFARDYDLKLGTIGQRLVAVEPTVFLGVPRVWEKIAEKMQAVGASASGLQKLVSDAAKSKGLARAEAQQLGGSGAEPFGMALYQPLLDVVRGKLGLGKCKFAFAGAAPMMRETLAYFGSLGISVNEAYGMSESSAATTWATDEHHLWGTVGYEIPGSEVRCFNKDAGGAYVECPRAEDVMRPTAAEQGEICFRGRHVMMGYLCNPALGAQHVETLRRQNQEAIDQDGWLHSGDKGTVGKNGMVRITGRFKELLKCAGGENVAPVPIEDNVKLLAPCISNIMLVGDTRKYIVALITLKTAGATGELPGTNETAGAAKAYGATVEEACQNPKLVADLTKAFVDTNLDGLCCPSPAAQVKKFTILPRDFSVKTGEFTATQKLKRFEVEKMNDDIINAIYESPPGTLFVPYSAVGHYELTDDHEADEHHGAFKAAAPLRMIDDINDPAVQAVLAYEKEMGNVAIQYEIDMALADAAWLNEGRPTSGGGKY